MANVHSLQISWPQNDSLDHSLQNNYVITNDGCSFLFQIYNDEKFLKNKILSCAKYSGSIECMVLLNFQNLN